MENTSNNLNIRMKKCIFCKKHTNDPLLGEKCKIENLVCHYFCLTLSNHLMQKGADNEGIFGFLLGDIRKEVQRCRNKRCAYCSKLGANIDCSQKNCKVSFHLPCGLARGTSHEFMGTFPSYCADHHKIQRLPTTLLNSNNIACVICLEDINVRKEKRNIIWASCCKRRTFMHRICVQQYANSAGYDIKCPNCSNSKDFVACLLKTGIFCPLREASWEQNGSFNDLLHSERCCLPVCKAQSRTLNRVNTLWELIKCSRCSAFCVHRKCGGFHLLTESFLCDPCQGAIKHELPPEPRDRNVKPCAAHQCYNPNGRYSFSNSGDWESVDCSHCSHFVAHHLCSNSSESDSTWVCNSYATYSSFSTLPEDSNES